jgi:hypothetical protein
VTRGDQRRSPSFVILFDEVYEAETTALAKDRK